MSFNTSIYARQLIAAQYISLRGKVLLKGRRTVGASDDYEYDSDADDDLTELQSVWTDKTTVTVSLRRQRPYRFISCLSM